MPVCVRQVEYPDSWSSLHRVCGIPGPIVTDRSPGQSLHPHVATRHSHQCPLSGARQETPVGLSYGRGLPRPADAPPSPGRPGESLGDLVVAGHGHSRHRCAAGRQGHSYRGSHRRPATTGSRSLAGPGQPDSCIAQDDPGQHGGERGDLATQPLGNRHAYEVRRSWWIVVGSGIIPRGGNYQVQKQKKPCVKGSVPPSNEYLLYFS